MYAEDVQRYIDIFGRSKVKIIIFEEFIKVPKKTMMEILLFLGIDNELDNFEGETYNKFGVARGAIAQFILGNRTIRRMSERIISPSVRRLLREQILLKKQPKPKMDQEDRDILIKFYKEDVKNLEKILGRSLPWKNFH